MSICTADQAVEAMSYWVGYYEKATSKYVSYRDKKYFETDKGSNNYTYAGYICGLNGPDAAWCAMQDSTAIYEACGNSKTDAKTVMWGIWPYSRCDQLYDAAPSSAKGRRSSWRPQRGDVIIFGKTQREHTGMVEKVDSVYVYTIEGNKSNMCKRCQYKLTDTSIWGYVRPNYKDTTKKEECTVKTYVLKEGSKGSGVKVLQAGLTALGYSCGIDGDFGIKTGDALEKYQKAMGLKADREAGADTLAKLLYTS